MAKILYDARRDFRPHRKKAFKKSIMRMVLEELASIVVPPQKVRFRYVKKWYRSVKTGRWVRVWKPERI